MRSLHQAKSTVASLGVALYPLDFSEQGILLRHADEAMYLSKRQRGNQVTLLPQHLIPQPP